MLIRPVTFVDTFAVVGRLHRLKATFEDVLPLREDDGTESAAYTEWRTLRRMLIKAGLNDNFGAVRICRLMPGCVEDWAKELSVLRRVIVPLVTNPLCIEYRRQQSAHMPVGSVWVVQTDQPGSSANWGDIPRYHLQVDLKAAEPEVEGGDDAA